MQLNKLYEPAVACESGNSCAAHANDTEHYVPAKRSVQEYLVSTMPEACCLRVNSDVMTGAGIRSGDTVIIDRLQKALDGNVVIAVLNGEMLIRRLEKTHGKTRLLPETAALSPIDIDATSDDFAIWGVVTGVIHTL